MGSPVMVKGRLVTAHIKDWGSLNSRFLSYRPNSSWPCGNWSFVNRPLKMPTLYGSSLWRSRLKSSIVTAGVQIAAVAWVQSRPGNFHTSQSGPPKMLIL